MIRKTKTKRNYLCLPRSRAEDRSHLERPPGIRPSENDPGGVRITVGPGKSSLILTIETAAGKKYIMVRQGGAANASFSPGRLPELPSRSGLYKGVERVFPALGEHAGGLPP